MLGCIYLSTPLEPFVEGAHDVSGGHSVIRRGKSEVTAETTIGRSLPTYLFGFPEVIFLTITIERKKMNDGRKIMIFGLSTNR